METCKSPRKVLNAAHALATACFKARSKFSRKDFTDAQLFACLVLREHQKKSYRGLVALLEDVPEWCRDIGMGKKCPITTRSKCDDAIQPSVLRAAAAAQGPLRRGLE